MNGIKVNVYENVLKKICDKYNGPEDFINEKIEGICFHERGNLYFVSFP